MEYKRGVSPIIASVLIILLTITAIFIIGNFIIPVVKEGLYGSTRCLPYKEFVRFDDSLGFNCMQGNNSLVSVKMGSDKEIYSKVTGLKVVVSNGIDSVSKEIPSTDVKLLNGNDAKIPSVGGTQTYNISLNGVYSTAEVYPVIEGKVCEGVQKINLGECS